MNLSAIASMFFFYFNYLLQLWLYSIHIAGQINLGLKHSARSIIVSFNIISSSDISFMKFYKECLFSEWDRLSSLQSHYCSKKHLLSGYAFSPFDLYMV